MNICTVVGFAMAWIVMIWTASMGGQGLSGFFDIHAFLIVFGGTTAAVIMAVDKEDMMAMPRVMKKIFGGGPSYAALSKQLIGFSEVARRDGILALESTVQEIKDETMKKALQLAIDGTSSEDIEKYFEVRMEVDEQVHEHGKKVIEFYEKWAPSFGLLGTLQGLILMLQNLSDPDMIAPSMGVAMVATFYGAFVAFGMGGPAANKLQRAFDNEHHKNLMIKDGILAIQNGANPRLLEDRLAVYTH
ncbi:MAG: motility protein A [Planctomycetota bacterium]